MSAIECQVCGLPGAQELERSGPHEVGFVCSPACDALVVLADLDETTDDRKFTAWQMRRRRAEVRQLPFTEAAPLSGAERIALQWQAWGELRGAA